MFFDILIVYYDNQIFNSNITFQSNKYQNSFTFEMKQFLIFIKLVDCLEKRLIYRHIRRFADWFYYSFTTFNELSLDMQKHLRSCRIDRCTTLRDTSKRKNKISTTYKAAFLTPTQENRNAAIFMPSCYAVRGKKALIYAALRARK